MFYVLSFEVDVSVRPVGEKPLETDAERRRAIAKLTQDAEELGIEY